MPTPYQPSLLQRPGNALPLLALGLAIDSGLQRGGWPLLRSMLSRRLRKGDHPRDWLRQLRRPRPAASSSNSSGSSPQRS